MAETDLPQALLESVMVTFGTSAYLKLLALNSQPRDTELRKRLGPTESKGYDFHKAMRHIATEFASGKADWHSTKASLRAIRKPAERHSATSATFALKRWVGDREIMLLHGSERRVPSPNNMFSIKFSPDFQIYIDGILLQVHIWNTKTPPIRIREAIGTLGLFALPETPRSIAILSLRTNELFVPNDYRSARELSRLLALDIERRFTRISEEYSERKAKRQPEERRAGH